jgi:hypothetical protein
MEKAIQENEIVEVDDFTFVSGKHDFYGKVLGEGSGPSEGGSSPGGGNPGGEGSGPK